MVEEVSAVLAVSEAHPPAADDLTNIALQQVTFSRADDGFVKAFVKKEPADTCAKMTFTRI